MLRSPPALTPASLPKGSPMQAEQPMRKTLPPPLNLIVSGSSHMSRTIPHIKAKGIAVIDLTERNWHLNAKSLASLVSKIQATSLNTLSVLDLDLFGNTSVRFKQADDTLSLAVKLPGEGGWHLMGDTVYTPDEILKEQVRSLSGLEISLKSKSKIFIPPIPRFVFGSCCDNKTHGTNINTPLHPQHALAEHTRQRHTIIKTLNSTGITSHRVLDVIQSINKAQDTPYNRTTALKLHTHKDNIHLTPEGYRLLADSIIATASSMTSQPAVTQGPPRGIKKIY